jgi:hypothetical protein
MFMNARDENDDSRYGPMLGLLFSAPFCFAVWSLLYLALKHWIK